MERNVVHVNRCFAFFASREGWNAHMIRPISLPNLLIFFLISFFLFSNKRACPFYGILEILASNVVVWTTKVATVDGPICSFCERNVSRIYRTTTNPCVSCEHNYITTLFPPTPRILDIPKKDVPRKNKMLVFLCARLSSGNTLTVGYFDKLVASLEQSER
jgi:hypothetical protein